MIDVNISDIPIFYIKYLTVYKVHMQAGAIKKVLHGCVLYALGTSHTLNAEH